MNEMRIVPALFFGTIIGMLLTLLITTPFLSEAIEFLQDSTAQLQLGLTAISTEFLQDSTAQLQLGLTAISTIAIYILLGRKDNE